ncbi:MAG: FRG domain-containing protein [Gammaproteobacteria bacterium]|nr:FRG domain-containing protein [Gammaproteobacteria bacterium]MCW5584260.1 FRG domain-containing protein [Gammaproteobacteria bacterium]
MINSVMYDPYELIEKLTSLKKLGYIFRGHPNATWRLIPRVFRYTGQKYLTENYPIKDNTYYWYFNKEIKRIVELWAKIKFDHLLPQGLRRIFDLYVFIIKYNYGINKFNNENLGSIYSCDEKTLARPQRDWESEQTFIDFIGNILQNWLNIYNLDGSLRYKARPFEELTIIEESFPQHYGFPTAALDFSKNPFKALWFALLNNFSNCFTIFAYKQITTISTFPTKIIENTNQNNIRAIKQEGCFVYFTRPCYSYVYKNKFPSLNDCDKDIQYGVNEPYFKIERIDVPKKTTIISVLDQFLLQEDINKNTLGL